MDILFLYIYDKNICQIDYGSNEFIQVSLNHLQAKYAGLDHGFYNHGLDTICQLYWFTEYFTAWFLFKLVYQKPNAWLTASKGRFMTLLVLQ